MVMLDSLETPAHEIDHAGVNPNTSYQRDLKLEKIRKKKKSVLAKIEGRRRVKDLRHLW
ncbi:hypothetical protein C5167_033879 [Papaver somniferum]|uniref:Uncharacterized protein n=1 Tax=Papaver somniferum TaxID=3469 RepID=A0A4Y7KEG1_PAPSO|nr:hypothetical protein C5167_033879 [Papaver somniferum]